MGTLEIVLIILGALLLVIGLWYIITYNKFVKLKHNVEESLSSIDVSSKKRYDLIPNIVNTVKGYAKHEQDTFDKIIKARNEAFSATTPEDKAKAEKSLSAGLKNLFALAESYPTLKADSNYCKLQDSLEKVEAEMANSRRFFNANVKALNICKEVFPSNIIAKRMNIPEYKMYEVLSNEERENVKVEF